MERAGARLVFSDCCYLAAPAPLVQGKVARLVLGRYLLAMTRTLVQGSGLLRAEKSVKSSYASGKHFPFVMQIQRPLLVFEPVTSCL